MDLKIIVKDCPGSYTKVYTVDENGNFYCGRKPLKNWRFLGVTSSEDSDFVEIDFKELMNHPEKAVGNFVVQSLGGVFKNWDFCKVIDCYLSPYKY